MNKIVLTTILFVSLVGCSPPEPPQLQASNEVMLGRSFPAVSQRWQAIQGNVAQNNQWTHEWLIPCAAVRPVADRQKTEFFYYAQHSDRIFVLHKDAQARFRVVEYLTRNGVSPAIIHEVADESLDTFISIQFVRESTGD